MNLNNVVESSQMGEGIGLNNFNDEGKRNYRSKGRESFRGRDNNFYQTNQGRGGNNFGKLIVVEEEVVTTKR